MAIFVGYPWLAATGLVLVLFYPFLLVASAAAALGLIRAERAQRTK